MANCSKKKKKCYCKQFIFILYPCDTFVARQAFLLNVWWAWKQKKRKKNNKNGNLVANWVIRIDSDSHLRESVQQISTSIIKTMSDGIYHSRTTLHQGFSLAFIREAYSVKQRVRWFLCVKGGRTKVTFRWTFRWTCFFILEINWITIVVTQVNSPRIRTAWHVKLTCLRGNEMGYVGSLLPKAVRPYTHLNAQLGAGRLWVTGREEKWFSPRLWFLRDL